METVAAIFAAIAKFFGYETQRDAERNAPDVKAAKIAQQEQDQKAAEAKAVQERDTVQVRKNLAE